MRQPATSATAEATSRPARPPMVLPAISRPTAPPRWRGATSRVTWAIASAGSAASAIPCSPRSSTSSSNDGASGAARPSSAAAPSATVITRVRPHDSATAESGTIASASVRVVADSARLEVDAATPNCVASVGRSPCTA